MAARGMSSMVGFALLMIVLIGVAVGSYVASVRRSDGIDLVGIVDADEVTISSRITGRISELRFDEGQPIKAGETIAVIQADELTASREQAAANALQQRSLFVSSKLEAAETAQELDAQILVAEAAVKSAAASLQQSGSLRERQRRNTVRVMAMADEGVVSKQSRDEAELALQSFERAEDVARDNLLQATAQLQLARAKRNDVDVKTSAVAAAMQSTRAAEAAARVASINAQYSTIVSPITGMIGTRAARQGELVAAGVPIVTILDLSHTWVYLPIPETYADRVYVGEVLTASMPSGASIAGVVESKAALADFATQRDVSRTKRDLKTIRIKLRIPNTDYRFVPGMTVDVVLKAGGHR